jgi:intein-encoded DNA endonuclease-like protein
MARKITHYTLKQYKQAIKLKKQGLGSQRIANLLGIPNRGAIEDWINKGRKPYYFSDKRINACNSKENVERIRALNRITQPLAIKKAAEVNKKKLPNTAKKISLELGYILGVIYGDGCISVKQRRVILSAVDYDFVLTFRKALEKWGGFRTKFYSRKIKTDSIIKNRKLQWVAYIDSLEAAKFLKNFDINNLLIPHKKIRYAFLRGFFDSEGSIDKDNTILAYNTNKKLVYFAQKLLNSVKITSRIKSYKVKNMNGKEIDYYHLKIDKDDRLDFFNKIGFSIERKQCKLRNYINRTYSPLDTKHIQQEVQKMIEEGQKRPERNPDDHSVFIGGKPFNLR